MQPGLFDPPWWAYVLVMLALTHLTIAAVTIYFHRHQAHRALDLHPAVSHFFRFWLWLTTGMVTREWVAVHRKHHAATETATDPHSPRICGIRKVLLESAELYRSASRDPECLRKFGHATPDDWIERHLYARRSMLGMGIMLGVDLILFGPIGLTIWAVQMLWIPLFAAGVINGIGHYWGYRNFAPSDASTNIVPWGILIGGEELHNNHHAHIGSARFSSRWWEIDVGWLYVRVLAGCQLTAVRRVAPAVRQGTARAPCDNANLTAVIVHRRDVLARFARSLNRTVADAAMGATPPAQRAALAKAAGRWLRGDGRPLTASERDTLDQAMRASTVLATVRAMREDLTALWGQSSASSTQLARQPEEWCARTEHSGSGALCDFAGTLRRYELRPGDPT